MDIVSIFTHSFVYVLKRFLRRQHRDMADLEQALQRTRDARARLIVTDGIFSMDGNMAPLGAIRALADKYEVCCLHCFMHLIVKLCIFRCLICSVADVLKCFHILASGCCVNA